MEYFVTPIKKQSKDNTKDWKDIFSFECNIEKKSDYENPTCVLKKLGLDKVDFYKNSVFDYLTVNSGAWEFYLLSLYMKKIDGRKYLSLRNKINENREISQGRDSGSETFKAYRDNYGEIWTKDGEFKNSVEQLKEDVESYYNQLFNFIDGKNIREKTLLENRMNAAESFFNFLTLNNKNVQITSELCNKNFDEFLIPFIEEENNLENSNKHFLASGVLVCLFGYKNPHKYKQSISLELKKVVIEGLRKYEIGDEIIKCLEDIDKPFEPIMKNEFMDDDRNSVKLRIGTWKSLLKNTLLAMGNTHE